MISYEKIKEILATSEYEIARMKIFPRQVDCTVKEHFLKPVPLVLHGIRRSGKTYIMNKLMQENPGGVYINFEDERFIGSGSDLLDEIYNIYIGVKSPERPVMFLDEVQNIKGWEKFVARLQSKVKFVISGSNASLMSSEYSSALTGRHIPLRIFPLSFAEFLVAKGTGKPDFFITETLAVLRALFADYIQFGGFPEASLSKDKTLLKSYFDSIIYRDVIPRFNIQNAAGIEALSRYLVSNPGKPFSFRKLIPVTNIRHEDTIKSYINFLEKAYLFTQLQRFDYSLKKQMVNLKKIYPADTSFSKYAGSLFSEERGRMLETIICNELKRRNADIFYWKNAYGKEVDFVVCQGLKPLSLIQVSERIENEKIMKRETEPLLLAAEDLKVEELILLTEVAPHLKAPYGITIKTTMEFLLQ